MIGQRIEQKRKHLHMSRDELAKRAHVTRQTVGSLEDNSNQNPRLNSLQNIALALGVSVAYLIGEGHPIPDKLREFAIVDGISFKDLDPLIQMNFEGKEATSPEEWKHLLESYNKFPKLYERLGQISGNDKTNHNDSK